RAFIRFLKPLNGVRNIWVKSTEEDFAKARPVTADAHRPIPTYFWSRDGRTILFIQDQNGDENYNVYAVRVADPVPAGAEAPPARNLTEARAARAVVYE